MLLHAAPQPRMLLHAVCFCNYGASTVVAEAELWPRSLTNRT